ncbi:MULTISPECIES: hypothetical protein [unclassified Aureispira]|uniref:hypothetical protein n=1 Tax=unclassified Aureispira TaxID=2649989 RepID=UPI000698B28E|nr:MULTISPECIES: hypothetical protein [unclassified Aureispira]WMX15180.1 hypothetical protein QP953_02200 [Aureispira sp. CCB-E]
MQLLFTGHLISAIILFFMGIIHVRSLQVVIANIEVVGFDPIAYDEPAHNFAIRAVFFCALTIFVGYKTRARLPLIGAFLVGNGSCFLGFGLIMIGVPRYVNMYDAFWYWCFYMGANLILTIIAIAQYEKAAPITPIYQDNVLDDFLDDFLDK